MNRNWLEDFDHDNGCYENTCVSCQATFVGHKRRVTCKICSALATATAKIEALEAKLAAAERLIDSAVEIKFADEKTLKFVPKCGWTFFKYINGERQDENGAVLWTKRVDYDSAIEAFEALQKENTDA